MTRVFKKVIFTFTLLAFLTLGARAYYLAALDRPSSSSGPQLVTIAPGMGVAEIAKLLAERNLIHSEALFKIYLRLNDLEATLEAGEYEIPPHLNLKETVELLQHGTFDLKLTFPEGWRREEMAAYAAKVFNSDSKTFEEEFLAASEGMEGYLFPETYIVPRKTTAEELVRLMRKMFDSRFTEELRRGAKRRGLSEEEVVILASIVEREVRFDEDRAKVAGILIKRWRNGWPLEADATVQFAAATEGRRQPTTDNRPTGWWPKKLTTADLEIDSPYNTRKYRGLPPAPICSPGLEALEAVVNYQPTPYWYYVSDEEGRIHFSKTLDEHNEKVLKYTRG